ncbi:hypothetical protein [Undibacterium sp.]|uniref:hypothetical protein n=1 Tax=Undibacterium sp. TaxID=1914977 RepID=UPI0025CEE9EA|nr:hypothetical protein [Undibacterium sp.]
MTKIVLSLIACAPAMIAAEAILETNLLIKYKSIEQRGREQVLQNDLRRFNIKAVRIK